MLYLYFISISMLSDHCVTVSSRTSLSFTKQYFCFTVICFKLKKDKSYTNSCIHNLLCLLERSVILILWVEMVFMSAVLLIGLQLKRLIGKNSHYRNQKKINEIFWWNRGKRGNNLSLTLTIRTSVKRCSPCALILWNNAFAANAQLSFPCKEWS